jgi:hypothetical protein
MAKRILFISGRDLPGKSAPPDRWDEDILRKPFGAEVFLEAVSRLLARRHSSPVYP